MTKANATTTIAQACKAIVKDAIDHDYLLECNQTAKEVYEVEFRKWNGCTPKACKDYLQGLPSVCTVPFYNGEILELLAAQGITRATEAGKERLIEAYWNECGYQFYKMIR